jgi:hypothetical protein
VKLTRGTRCCPLSSEVQVGIAPATARIFTESSINDSILPCTPRSSKRLFLLNVATKVYIAFSIVSRKCIK